MDFSLNQCIIHGSLVRHPWEPHVNHARTFMGTPHVYVHGNLAPHHYLAPLAIFLCWAFLFFLFSPGSLCVGHLGFLCPLWIGTMNTSPHSLHTNHTNLALIPLRPFGLKYFSICYINYSRKLPKVFISLTRGIRARLVWLVCDEGGDVFMVHREVLKLTERQRLTREGEIVGLHV